MAPATASPLFRAYAAVVNNLGTLVMLPLLAVTAVSALSQRWGVGAVGVALLVG